MGRSHFLALAATVAGFAQSTITTHSTIYLGTNRGLYRTIDGGNTAEMFYVLGSREILAVGAGSEDVLFAAAIDGLFRSADAGQNWALTNLPLGAAPRVILSDPERPDRVYAAGNGLWASSDGGYEWSEVTGFEAPVMDLVMNPADSTFLLAATAAGIYRSTDRGVNWQRIPNSPPVRRMTVAAAAPLRVFAVGKDVFLSTDRGETWAWLLTEVADVAWYAGGLSATGGLDVQVSMNSVTGLIADPSRGDLKHIAFEGCLTIPPSLYMAACSQGLLTMTQLWFGLPVFGWHLETFVDVEALSIDPRSGNVYAGGSRGLFRAVESSWGPAPGVKNVRVHSILVHP
jgi:Sortilin, neurotensin receptor 3,